MKITKANQTKFRAEKVIKRKGDTLYVKWKGYDNSWAMIAGLIKKTLYSNYIKMRK